MLRYYKDTNSRDTLPSSFLLISIRQYIILPKLFELQYLSELDAAEYEESEALTHCQSFNLSDRHLDGTDVLEGINENVDDAKILDEITTRSRCELKHRHIHTED